MKHFADFESAVRNELSAHTPPIADLDADRAGPLLSVVIPTLNERDNVRAVVDQLSAALTGINWEVIFVDDDSPDGTADLVHDLGRQRARIRCIRRIGRRGLSSACVEGMLGSSAPYIAVMDCGVQHDPTTLPTMLAILRDSDADLVVGSRYVNGGGKRDGGRLRRLLSRLAARAGRVLVPETLQDPMSGFFMLRRPLLEDAVRNLSPVGFKLLVDIVASAPRPVAIREVPFKLRPGKAGTNGRNDLTTWEYLMLLADKLIGRYVPARFVAFATIGTLGLLVHLSVLTVAFRLEGINFTASQTLAVVVTMIFNYFLNNILTYSDRRRRGLAWLTGLVSFMTVCGIGAIANVGVASYVFNKQNEWLLAAVAGAFAGAVWNYATSGMYTWGRPKPAKK